MAEPVVPKGFGPPLGMYSHGMVARGGDLVIVAGQVGMTADGRVAGEDVVSQTKQALDNVRAVVEAAGCTMGDVVRLQTFLTRSEDIAGFMRARGEVFPTYFPDGIYPPNTLLVVSRLVRPELLVEVEAMAIRTRRAKPKRRAPAKRRRARR
ncbi:MAG TPA: RidA family protein [Patescibacteria group bacterium]|jgi:enamine deaminase RidA (YjgF/YER057c/UK114 family)|nr:RidA family protein [Patescibacteria group bacterium]